MAAKGKRNVGKLIELKDVHEQLRVHNRLTILSLVKSGVQQSDIAAGIGVSKSVITEMFPKGLLKRISGRDQN